MAIAISSSIPQTETYKTPRVQHTAKELEALKKEPTSVVTSGDVYTSSAVHFKKLSLEELKNETIVADTSKQTYVSHSDGTKNEPNRLVVMRDPENNGTYVTMELSQTSINHLKQKFDGANNFFERDDGVLRLNGEAEAFVAGWMDNIKTERHYAKSDTNGNGLIEGDEAKTLNIGFERQGDYDYIGKKIVKINFSTGENYQELGRTSSSLFADKEESSQLQTKRTASNANYIQFENSIEKELEHTLKMDADLNGTVTLEEGLSDEFGKDYRKKVISEMEEFHKDLLRNHPDLDDTTQLLNHTMGVFDIISKEEEEASLQQMNHEALTISTLELLNFANLNTQNTADTLEPLQMHVAKSTYAEEQADTTTLPYGSFLS